MTTIVFKLGNGCLNCDKDIPMDFMICSPKCLKELAKEAKSQGIKSYYDLGDCWRKR